MLRQADTTTRDYTAFLENTPPRFYAYYTAGSVLIVGVAIALFTMNPSDVGIAIISALGVALLALLAVGLVRHFSPTTPTNPGDRISMISTKPAAHPEPASAAQVAAPVTEETRHTARQ